MQTVSIGSTDLPELSIDMHEDYYPPATISNSAFDSRNAYFELLALSLEAQRTKKPFYLH